MTRMQQKNDTNYMYHHTAPSHRYIASAANQNIRELPILGTDINGPHLIQSGALLTGLYSMLLIYVHCRS